jgi:ArsR family transcriptional regulator
MRGLRRRDKNVAPTDAAALPSPFFSPSVLRDSIRTPCLGVQSAMPGVLRRAPTVLSGALREVGPESTRTPPPGSGARSHAICPAGIHRRHFSPKGVDNAVDCGIIRNMSNNREARIERFAQMFGALSNPNRLRIFLRLVSCCPGGASCLSDEEATAYVGELGQDLGIAPSTVSHHIKELHRAGLIEMERRGQRVACCADAAVLQDLAGFFSIPQDG